MAVLVRPVPPHPCVLGGNSPPPQHLQVIYHSRNLDILLHDIFDRVRCPSVLANPRDVLLRPVRVDHEKAITVSGTFFFSSMVFNQFLDT